MGMYQGVNASEGIGIGTVAATLLVGGICTLWGRLLNRRLMAFME